MKRIVTMQDISGVGKCSLTVALPIISAMGVEASVLPTSILSTHTMFKGFTFHDLTSELTPIMDHWQKEGLIFDGIYTGYLGSFEQIDIATDLIQRFGKDKPVLVDPCMADNGKLYAGFSTDFAKAMRNLCAKADIICPNLTEASFMLEEPYVGDDYDETYVKETLKKLTGLGASVAVLTGISLQEGKIGAYAYNATTDEWFQYYADEQPEKFHGTGDIWASTFFASMIRGFDFKKALEIACEYTSECIRITLAEEHHNKYGVNFEQALPYLFRLSNEIKL